MNQKALKNPLNVIVIVAALGYFVDIYDLILFSIVRVSSLQDLGITGDALTTEGLKLLNIQMIGMLLGGILWGVLGDKRGRLSVLFFTILLYSVANILNGMITNLTQYQVLRFIAGIGLSGELGLGITLVSEVMTKETRGYGTTIVSGVGIAGAAVGFFVADIFDWRVAYYVGGGLGLLLLLMRISMYESGMYSNIKSSNVERGSFDKLFTNGKRFGKYLKCILIGVPVWFIISILITLAPEFASSSVLNIQGSVVAGKAVMYHYIGASLGAFVCGFISQYLKSRKKALLLAITGNAIVIALILMSQNVSASVFYFLLFLLGIPNGYWSVFVTTASEQFGTNMRATATTTVPNFVRGAVVIVTSAFTYMTSQNYLSFIGATIAIGTVVFLLAMYSTLTIDESFDKDLNYTEEF